jgi:hypothetical protein
MSETTKINNEKLENFLDFVLKRTVSEGSG